MADQRDAVPMAQVSLSLPEHTGAYIALLDTDDADGGMAALRRGAGTAEVQHLSMQDAAAAAEMLDQGGSVLFDEIGVALVSAQPDQRSALRRAAAEAPNVLALEPERTIYALESVVSVDYLRGYRDGVDHLAASTLEVSDAESVIATRLRIQVDESRATWGLQAIRALESAFTGKDVRVCILDTGVDTAHPDLAAHVAKTESFIAGQLGDGHGHGTHCTGTAFGPKEPQVLPRYGVAGEAEVFVGKVLSDQGSGADRGILAGINWAITEGCRVISMSLGAPTKVGDTFSRVYEAVAQRALRRGTLIVAAAGNESNRPQRVAPVGHPANCPSIMAVAALDPDLRVARFSCGGLNPDGGQVDIAAPGVDVHSSWPPDGYRRLQGTSMATPHVAGVAALLAEARPQASAAELWQMLVSSAQRLPLPATDVGAGLVQAP